MCSFGPRVLSGPSTSLNPNVLKKNWKVNVQNVYVNRCTYVFV